MENLWAPWRMEYILKKKPSESSGCVFCVQTPDFVLDKGVQLSGFVPLTQEDVERLVVCRGQEVFVMLNRYPYAAGHLMVIPYRHIMDFTELTVSENAEIMHLMQVSCKVLGRECKPDGINMGINLGSAAGAGIADHLHFHVVPRWAGDSQFIAVVSDVRLIPEHLEDTQKRFALAFREIIG